MSSIRCTRVRSELPNLEAMEDLTLETLEMAALRKDVSP